ncbi:hypothetical protein H0H92_006886 [Tricholoma furcatifolium]|nr:hypothetical protein H0H92_006886 [Tricholoma furcatifolium]
MAPRGGRSEPATPGPRALRARPEPAPQPAPKTRRTSEQVRKDNSAKETAKQKKKEARSSMINDVAHLEATLIEEDTRMLEQAHHPPASTQKKVPRPRPVPSGRGATAKKDTTNAAYNDIDKEKNSENNSEMRLTNSDDEPDASMGALQNLTTEGASVRALVTATRQVGNAANVAGQDEDKAGHKRKASASGDFTVGVASSKKMRKHNGGLRNDWNRPNAAPVQKKAEIRITDLNDSVRRIWDSAFKPRVIEYLGTLTPWQPFSDDDVAAIQDIWVEVYPFEPPLETDAKLYYIVNKLLDDIITAWQHKFSSTANQYLTSNIFESPELSTPDARRAWAEWALARDVTPDELENAPEHSRRFYYREYEEPEQTGRAAIFRGIFQSPIVIATLASHFQWLEKINIADRGEEFPMGALVLTIQACRHHISQWTSGSCVKPAGPLANFSAANWGDRQDRDGPSGLKNTNLTTDVVNAVEELSKKQCDRIKEAVMEYLRRQNKSNAKRLATAVGQPAKTSAMKPRFKLRDQDDTDSEESEPSANAGNPTSLHRRASGSGESDSSQADTGVNGSSYGAGLPNLNGSASSGGGPSTSASDRGGPRNHHQANDDSESDGQPEGSSSAADGGDE